MATTELPVANGCRNDWRIQWKACATSTFQFRLKVSQADGRISIGMGRRHCHVPRRRMTVPVQEDFMEHAAPFRAELIAHRYRMLGSVHCLVQETHLRGWRGYQAFEERAALRTWLYRIATTACLRALENRARRVLPAGLGVRSVDPDAGLDGDAGGHEWLEPLPDA
jgi:Sigma-70 region 2